MSTALVTQNGGALALSDQEMIGVLENSLYPGASHDSIKMVIGYCRASGLDVMQKPVHIVPMYASTGKKDNRGYDIKAMRDVIMPGIGLYRTQAARGGSYAGVTEPEFGPDITETLGDQKITYPEWCKVAVKRILANGMVAEFHANERWKENYASKGRDNSAPNAMWTKRPYGQIAKCAEAQALRKAFPEFGSVPTADEMDGKAYTEEVVTDAVIVPEDKGKAEPEQQKQYPAEDFEKNFPDWESRLRAGRLNAENLIAKISAKGYLTDAQIKKIKDCEISNAEDVKEAEIAS